ncbi:hypothetical protein ACFLXV_00720 [Chloroflexota bacterium]
MDATTLLLLLLLVMAAMAIGAPIVLITMAAFIYVWINAYPWLKMVGKWAAKPANFIALITIFMLTFFIIIILALIIHPIFLILILFVLPILYPVELAIIVWMIRLVKWFFRRMSGSIDSVFLAVRLEFIKLKIKTDTLKDGGGRGKLGALKGEFSTDTRRVTGRVSEKKQGGFRSKLQALKGEFSSDVDKARGKLPRRK